LSEGLGVTGIPAKVLFAKFKCCYAKPLLWQAEEKSSFRVDARAVAGVLALFWPVQGVGPVGLQHIGTCSARKVLRLSNMFGWVSDWFGGIWSHLTRPEDDLYTRASELTQDIFLVFDLTADYSGASHAFEGKDWPFRTPLKERSFGLSKSDLADGVHK